MTTKATATKAAPKAEEVHEEALEQKDVLAGLPALLPPTQWRLRHRNALTLIMMNAGLLNDNGGLGDIDTEDPEQVQKIFGLAEETDKFAESLAADKKAYEKWSVAHSDDIQVFFELFTKLVNDLGESTGSTN